jgi:formate/nitrite transporter
MCTTWHLRLFVIIFLSAQAQSFATSQKCQLPIATVATTPRSTTSLSAMKSPTESYNAASANGMVKYRRSDLNNVVAGLISGMHIAFGSYLSLTVGGQCHNLAATNPGLKQLIVGAIGFPFATIMTTIGGGDIFTGSIFSISCSWFEKKVSLRGLFRYLSLIYIGNFIGGLLLANLAFIAGTLPSAVSINAAIYKTSIPFHVAFVRGILCSILICMAAFNANSGESLTDKAVAIFFPITAFVALGLENSVSNMFTIPFGMLHGAKVSVKTFLMHNLLPVTLGNLVGGFLGVTLPYAIVNSNRKAVEKELGLVAPA